MKINSFRDRYEYFVDKEKGVVVAQLREPYTVFTGYGYNIHIKHNQCDFELMDELFDKYPQYIHKMSAKARCDKNDIFDEDKGKRIARIRLENKIWKLWADYFRMRQQYYWDLGISSNHQYYNVLNMIDHNTDFLNTFKEDINDNQD